MHYQAPSKSSTRSASAVDVDPSSSSVKPSLRAESMPANVEVKKRPISLDSPKPDVKWPWKWRRGNSERRTRPASHFCSRSSALPTKVSPVHSVTSPASSPLWDETFAPSPPSSSAYSSFPVDDLHLTPSTSTDSATPANAQYSGKPVRQHSRRQSANKLARTLGALPPQDLDSLAEGKSLYDNAGMSTDVDSLTEPPISPRSRRMSLKLTTTLSLLRPPSRTQRAPRSRSKISLSTLNTDDVHRFGLPDDLSDNWGDSRHDSRASIYSSYSPISPITFKPPTPVAVAPSRRFSTLNLGSTAKVKPDEVTLSSPHPQTTLNRSRSLSLAPPRIGRLAQLANAHSAAESRPHTPTEDVDETRLPVRANWLESPIQEEEAKARSFMDAHPEYADEYKSWSGQWNQDDMQHVIKMLRSLK
ncbi:hypothetical protein DXG03_006380 [Asterophora parasitica]|uniref:Uncharacterized protein n=1 Tax=Asterophora parasitica TaxID=117018 RepID=A0A9P7FYR2_9AGAR|nr:hypothetical protein DXG03_006380 [Asterophora parasitica]